MGARSLAEVRSTSLRNIERPANAEPPRAAERLPRPSEMCKRVPVSTARPTARLSRSYAAIGRNIAGDLRRQSVRPSRSSAAKPTKPRAIIVVPPHVSNEQRPEFLPLPQAYERVHSIVFHPKTAGSCKLPVHRAG